MAVKFTCLVFVVVICCSRVHSRVTNLSEQDVVAILGRCNNPADPDNLFGLASKIATCALTTRRSFLTSKNLGSLSDVKQSLNGLSDTFKSSVQEVKGILGGIGSGGSGGIFGGGLRPRNVRPKPSERMNIVRKRLPRPTEFSVEQWKWILDTRYKKFYFPCRREEYRQMNPNKKDRYHKALNKLKDDYSLKPYDESKMGLLSSIHYNRLQFFGGSHPGAHRGGAFYPWHRQYLLLVENAVRSLDARVCLPYWDPSNEAALGEDAGQSHFWTAEFVGEAVGFVTKGPFANWNFTVSIPDDFPEFFGFGGNKLNRELFKPVFVGFGGALWNDEATAAVLDKTAYRDISWCTDMTGEQFHNQNHLAIGGFMVDGEYSTNDPLFFAWHAFVDRIWEEWRQGKQWKAENPYTSYSSECELFPGEPDYHAADMLMEPFELTNLEGVKDISRLYRYTERSKCSVFRPTCTSYNNRYLYCDRRTYTCVSKKVSGSSCRRTEECYNGSCKRRKCVGRKFGKLGSLGSGLSTGIGSQFSAL